MVGPRGEGLGRLLAAGERHQLGSDCSCLAPLWGLDSLAADEAMAHHGSPQAGDQRPTAEAAGRRRWASSSVRRPATVVVRRTAAVAGRLADDAATPVGVRPHHVGDDGAGGCGRRDRCGSRGDGASGSVVDGQGATNVGQRAESGMNAERFVSECVGGSCTNTRSQGRSDADRSDTCFRDCPHEGQLRHPMGNEAGQQRHGSRS